MTAKEQLIARAAQKRNLVPCPVKEWGDYFVLEMNGAERDAFEAKQLGHNKEGKGLVNFRARFVTEVLVDVEGNRIFTDDEAATVVGKLPAREVKKVFEVAAKLNGMTPEDEAEIQKN